MRTCFAFFAASVLLLTPAIASADIVWSGDFETGDLSQYDEQTGPVAERVTLVTDPVRQGTYAARMEIRPGDLGNGNLNRVELGYHPPMAGFEGSERWYAFSAMQDPAAPLGNGWHAFAYWEADVLYTGALVFGLHPGGELRFDTRVGDDATQFSTFFQPGVWHDFVLHVVWSPDPQQGLVELWYDGEQVVPPTDVATMYTMGNGTAPANFFHIGMIRDETLPNTEVLFHDRVLEATDAEDAMGVDEPTGTGTGGGGEDTTSGGDEDTGTTGDSTGGGSSTTGTPPGDGGAASSSGDDIESAGSSGEPDPDEGTSGASADTEDGGCACRARPGPPRAWWMLGLPALLRRRRRNLPANRRSTPLRTA